MSEPDLPFDCLIPPDPEPGFDPRWRTGAVLGLARAIMDTEAFDRMPILADALEDAGCGLADVLDHCRQADGHAPDCWVIGWILRSPDPAGQAQPDAADPPPRVTEGGAAPGAARRELDGLFLLLIPLAVLILNKIFRFLAGP